MKLLINVFCGAIVFCFTLSIYSCKEKPMDFSKVDSLKLEKTFALDSVICTYPVMRVSHNLCCVADNSSYDAYFHIFTFPDFKYIKSVGHKGNGHGELNPLLSFSFRDNTICALGGNGNKIVSYEIEKGTFSETYLSDDIHPIQICNDDSCGWYVYSVDSEYMLYRIDGQGKAYPIMREPEPSDKYPGFQKNYLWQSVIEYSNGILTYATTSGDYISFLSKEQGFGCIGSYESDNGKPKPTTKRYGNKLLTGITYIGYADLCLQKERIYAFFRGEELKSEPSANIENTIRTFDYKGSPLTKYKIEPTIEPSSFYVDEQNKKIYMTIPDNENQIFVFDF